jgi:hypothetical protein
MKKPTLAIAKRMIKEGNPEIKNLKVSWNFKPSYSEMKGNRGSWFWSAIVNVTADGYKPKKMIFTVDSEGTWIR